MYRDFDVGAVVPTAMISRRIPPLLQDAGSSPTAMISRRISPLLPLREQRLAAFVRGHQFIQCGCDILDGDEVHGSRVPHTCSPERCFGVHMIVLLHSVGITVHPPALA